MKPDTFSPAQQELIEIIQTHCEDAAQPYALILDLIYRQNPSDRPALMGDLLVWMFLIPEDVRRADATKSATIEEHQTAVDLLNALYEKMGHPSALDLNLGQTPLEAGGIVMAQLDALAEHGRIVQLQCLMNLLVRHPDVPFTKHLTSPAVPPPPDAQEVIGSLPQFLSLLLEMECIMRKEENLFHELACWVTNLPTRTGGPEIAYRFIRYLHIRLLRLGEERARREAEQPQVITPDHLTEFLESMAGPQEPDPDDPKKKPN